MLIEALEQNRSELISDIDYKKNNDKKTKGTEIKLKKLEISKKYIDIIKRSFFTHV